jgi:hypothetical protein
VGVSYGAEAQGVTLLMSQWDACNYAVYVQASGSNLDQLTVTGCQINCNIAGINVQSILPNVTILNTLFVMVANSMIAVNLSFNDYFNIIGNNFNGSGGTGMVGVIIGTSNGDGIISSNTFFNMNAGIDLQSGAAGCNIQGNTFTTVTSPIVNGSPAQNHRIESNKGYNPVGTSTPGVGASPFTYHAGPSPETLYIVGGSGVSNISTQGVTIATATSPTLPVTLDLGPNETVTITYSTTAPFMNRIIH